MLNYEITIPCSNGFTLYADAKTLVVSTKRKEEVFPISKIQSFTIKEPRTLSPGKIIFCTAQSSNAGINLGLGITAAMGAEKSFFFYKDSLDDAIKLRDLILNYDVHPTQSPKTTVSVVEEIRGLKGLLDDGIITEAEFEAKKKILLGI